MGRAFGMQGHREPGVVDVHGKLGAAAGVQDCESLRGPVRIGDDESVIAHSKL